jgi:hypothetical protein
MLVHLGHRRGGPHPLEVLRLRYRLAELGMNV